MYRNAFIFVGILSVIALIDAGLGPKDFRDVHAVPVAQKKEVQKPIATKYKALQSKIIRKRVESARSLAGGGKADAVPFLIDALSDEGRSPRMKVNFPEERLVRYWANKALLKITRENFHFAWNGGAEDRDAAIIRWRRWYSNKNRHPPDPNDPAIASLTNRSFDSVQPL